jgi:putative membrane protein insertion efficiency factor
MKSFLIVVLRGYRYWISPLMGRHCRFYPTCSEYAVEAIAAYGAVRGLALALRRLGRCHPWHAGGVDPVPQQHHHQCKAADHG